MDHKSFPFIPKDLNFPVIPNDLFDSSLDLHKLPFDAGTGPIGSFEQELLSLSNGASSMREVTPIVAYVSVLRAVRALSNQTSNYQQEIGVAHAMADGLSTLGAELGLPEGYYDVDTSGEPIVLREGLGEHVILPTHFEKGAYFSNPHADHQLRLEARALPRIKIGQYTRFGGGVGVNAGGDVTIGNAVWLSPGAYILKQNHDPYGRPSVGSRTVAMTQMPKIRFADYAWVGKEAIVGWAADYIGKAAIVASRSFVNGWVGDYSITGNNNKVVQYLPYKAAAFELFELDFEGMLRIANWQRVNDYWICLFEEFNRARPKSLALPSVTTLLGSDARRGARLLDMNPGLGDHLLQAAQRGLLADGVSQDRKTFPFILQRLRDVANKTVRLRGDVHPGHLPFETGAYVATQHKTVGYEVVLDTGLPSDIKWPQLRARFREAVRVAKPEASIVYSVQGEYDYSELIAVAKGHLLELVQEGTELDAAGRQQHVIQFRKWTAPGEIGEDTDLRIAYG
ncbi:MAG: hypothetical protein V4528_09910 [Pseudomonadota bacterium]